MTATNWVYPIFVFTTLTFALILIPRKEFREYFTYGFLVGGLVDVVYSLVLHNILGIIWFKNQGVFYVPGNHALSPIGWTLAAMLFLYFLPRRKSFFYFYILAWSLLSIGFGYIVQNAGLFDYQDWYFPLPALIIYGLRLYFGAWLFNATSSLPKG